MLSRHALGSLFRLGCLARLLAIGLFRIGPRLNFCALFFRDFRDAAGTMLIGDIEAGKGDGVSVEGRTHIEIAAREPSEILVIELGA